MKAIIFPYYFEAPDELNDFCRSLGYGPNPVYYINWELMFDQRVVEFCEQRLSKLWNEKVYRGKSSSKFRCGFAGAGYIREIDTSRKWRLKYNNVDAPVIEYILVDTNKYGYTTMVRAKADSSIIN